MESALTGPDYGVDLSPVGKGASETCHRGLACLKCLFDNQAASRARGLRVLCPRGATPLAPVGPSPTGNAWVPHGGT